MLSAAQTVTPRAAQKVLMIAYFFPPVGGIGVAGAQRVLKFVKYLPQFLWDPVVLTVKEPYYESYLSMDPGLLERVPAGTKIIRTSVIRWLTRMLEFKNAFNREFRDTAKIRTNDRSDQGASDGPSENSWYQQLKDTITDFFAIPDEEMGWFLPGLVAGLQAMMKERIDVVYSTGRPWTGFLIGAVLKMLTGKPLVTDFRDPWLTNPFREKYSTFRNQLEAYFEKKVIEKSDLVIANTPELREEFRTRFPEQPSEKFISLLNGFDPDDYSLGNQQHSSNCNNRFIMVHTGFLYGRRDPKTLLQAIRLLIDKQMIDSHQIKVFLVGTIDLTYSLKDYLLSNGLHEVVALEGHVPYKHSLEYLRKSDMLLLLQPGTTTQIPSKLFEYIAMRKPILAISPRDGATCNLVMQEGLGEIAAPDDVPEIAGSIYKLYQQWRMGASPPHAGEHAYHSLNVIHLTAVLAMCLSQVTARSRRL